MKQVWQHPRLGQIINLDDGLWRSQVTAPAFDAFGLRDGTETDPSSYEMTILDRDAAAEPPSAAVKLAAEIFDRGPELVNVISATLWNDFNGVGRRSPMWWHGALRQPDSKGGFQTGVPADSDDVLRLLRLTSIGVDNSIGGFDGFIAYLTFRADFEEEHGLGILTDGRRVMGAGYVGEFTVYSDLNE